MELSMKIQILSDMHLETRDYQLSLDPTTDVLVLAGDIGYNPLTVSEWVKAQVPTGLPVVMVLGNHECRGMNMLSVTKSYRQVLSFNENVHLLDQDTVTVGNVQFFGCTLWTDFKVLEPNFSAVECMSAANRFNKDFKGPIEMGHGRFIAQNAADEHNTQALAIQSFLQGQCPFKRVVVTHHCPLKDPPRDPRLNHGHLISARTSDMDDLVAQSDLWIYGHIHRTCRVGNAVSNARGIVTDKRIDNPDFQDRFIVEI
jgi:predicted phosphodiesterase